MRGLFIALVFMALFAPHLAVRSLRARGSTRKKGAAAGRLARGIRLVASSEYREASPTERRFWMAEWASVQSELLQLEKAAGGEGHKVQATRVADLELTGNRNLNATNGTNESPPSPKKKDLQQKPQSVAADKLTKENVTRALAMAKARTVGGMGAKAALAPMLGMLKDVYSDSKARISRMNSREKKSKEDFQLKEAKHKKRLVDIEAKHKNHTLSDEFYKNETRDEERMFSYFKRSRDLQHRQFHNMLKLTHGTMDREKTMIKAYEETIAGRPPPAASVQKLEAVAPPEVVFVQMQQKEILQFVKDALLNVRREMRYLSL